MTDQPAPARTAEIDQELARIAAYLDRSARRGFRTDVATAIAAVILIVPWLFGWVAPDRFQVIGLLAAVAFFNLASAVQYLMIRRYREEIRDLRARAGWLPGTYEYGED